MSNFVLENCCKVDSIENPTNVFVKKKKIENITFTTCEDVPAHDHNIITYPVILSTSCVFSVKL